MKRIYCDRCGEEVKREKLKTSIDGSIVKFETPLIGVVYNDRKLDLCRGCKIELSRVIESWDKS